MNERKCLEILGANYFHQEIWKRVFSELDGGSAGTKTRDDHAVDLCVYLQETILDARRGFLKSTRGSEVHIERGFEDERRRIMEKLKRHLSDY